MHVLTPLYGYVCDRSFIFPPNVKLIIYVITPNNPIIDSIPNPIHPIKLCIFNSGESSLENKYNSIIDKIPQTMQITMHGDLSIIFPSQWATK